jgi:Uncharacterised nucleotidyltransferase
MPPWPATGPAAEERRAPNSASNRRTSDQLTNEGTEGGEQTWQTPVITRIGIERTLGISASDVDGFSGSEPTDSLGSGNSVSSATGRRMLVARQISLDVAAAEAVTTLRRAGIRPILLKGASVSRWLYEGRKWERAYGDVDLLVAPECLDAAGQVLTQLGYVNRSFPDRAIAPLIHAYHWQRTGPRPADIDLHRRLFLVRTDDTLAWQILVQYTDTIELAGVEVDVLSATARTLLVALHAAWHGLEMPGPMRDLDRAIEVVDLETWSAAARLAVRLSAAEGFVAGLRMTPDGALIVARLGLSVKTSAELHLRAESADPASLALLRLLTESSWRQRITMLAGEVVPPPDAVRDWRPLARRGRRGLIAAYLWRGLWLIWRLPWAARAVARARRSAYRRG